jgi:hypothetical protein
MKLARKCLIFALLTISFCACGRGNQNAPAGGNSNAPKPANSNANQASANTNSANTNSAASAPKPKPGTGGMEVTSEPTGAGVTLIPTTETSAGLPQAYGATPAMITGLAPGAYTVSVSKTGYRNYQKEVKVKEGETIKIHASLRK